MFLPQTICFSTLNTSAGPKTFKGFVFKDGMFDYTLKFQEKQGKDIGYLDSRKRDILLKLTIKKKEKGKKLSPQFINGQKDTKSRNQENAKEQACECPLAKLSKKKFSD